MNLDHAALRKLCEEATPGPWFPRSTDDSYCMNARYVGLDEGPGFMHDGDCGMARDGADHKRVVAITLLQAPRLADVEQCDANTEFIATARTALPALLDENERLHAALDAVHDALGEDRGSDDVSVAEGVREWISAARSADAEVERLRAERRTFDCHDGGEHCSAHAPCLRCRVEVSEAEAESEMSENTRLRARISDLDCRYVGDVADVSGSHCLIHKPCLRCRAERAESIAQRNVELNERLIAERAALDHGMDGAANKAEDLRDRIAEMEKALGQDLAGRSFSELLMTAAMACRAAGGGPLQDCLEAKAADVSAALRPNGRRDEKESGNG